jgi:HK97 family phage prohead protease
MTAPIDNLVRARYDSGAAELRADGDEAGRTLFGHFAVFDRWTEIDSWYEGRFLERVGDKAFSRTFKERGDKIRVLYDHGHDPSIGNKPLGAPDVLRSEKGVGAYYESELFDSPYVEQLMPALRAKQLGASFRFRVTGEQWVEPKKASDHNPDKLPERTITDVDLYEFGPVTFPAYDDATAGVRSGSDTFIDRLLNNPLFLARFTERIGLNSVEHLLASLPADGRSKAPASAESTDGDEEQAAQARRKAAAIARARAALLA